MRALLPLIAVLPLAAGCFYDFPTEQKSRCDLDGACADGNACFGGQCVQQSRASCTVGDRRCIGTVAWSCAGGTHETGVDCAATGEVCVSGRCLPPCADGQCAAGSQCSPGVGACVPTSGCATDADCPDAQCFIVPNTQIGVCTPLPPEDASADLTCYDQLGGPDTIDLDAVVKRINLVGEVRNATGKLVTSQANFVADQSGAFKLTGVIPREPLSFVLDAGQFDSAAVVRSQQFGPMALGMARERAELTAFTTTDVEGLVKVEAGAVDPKYDPLGAGLLLGRVRDCKGNHLQNVTVGYSFVPGRVGYFGGEGTPLLQRQSKLRATGLSGGFLAYDVPVGVDLAVVATARKTGGSLLRLYATGIRVDAPPEALPYAPVSISLGRGGASQ